jgi:hypothetical protein
MLARSSPRSLVHRALRSRPSRLRSRYSLASSLTCSANAKRTRAARSCRSSGNERTCATASLNAVVMASVYHHGRKRRPYLAQRLPRITMPQPGCCQSRSRLTRHHSPPKWGCGQADNLPWSPRISLSASTDNGMPARTITCPDCGLVLRVQGPRFLYDAKEWRRICKRIHLDSPAACLIQRDGTPSKNKPK